MKAIAAALVLAGAASADPAEGLWRTPPDDEGRYGEVAVAPCGAALCGTITGIFGPQGALPGLPAEGRRAFTAMAPQGAGRYGGGTVWSPRLGRSFPGRLALTAEGLRVEGCAAGLCRGVLWQRVK